MNHSSSLLTTFNHIVIQGMEEILGKNDLMQAIRVDQSMEGIDKGFGSEQELREFTHSLQVLYGRSGGLGILLRSGRSSFKYLLEQYSNPLDLDSLGFRLLPTHQRIRRTLSSVADVLSSVLGACIKIHEEENAWLWQVERCSECWQHTSDAAMCTYTLGLLQEMMAWSGGGKFYPINESECLACGGKSCTFRIEKKPLD